jgi:hypothetical protein
MSTKTIRFFFLLAQETIQKPPLPTFDFHEFLEQFKNAPTISRYTKAFISSFFGKSRSTLDQQINSVQDFLSVSLSCLHCFSFFFFNMYKKVLLYRYERK